MTAEMGHLSTTGMTRRRALRLLSASATFSLLAACTSNTPGGGAGPATGGGTAAAPGGAAAAQPKNGGRLTLDVAFDINKLDPTRNFRRVNYHTAHAYGFL